MILNPAEIRPVAATPGVRPTLSAAMAGKVIEARLTLALADGLFRFSTPDGEIDLMLPRPLPTGTQVRMTMHQGGTLELTVMDDAAPDSAARLPDRTFPPVLGKVVGTPAPGVVRVNADSADMDLPLARPLPPGTEIRLAPQPDSTFRVSVPARADAAQAAFTVMTARPSVPVVQLAPHVVVPAEVIVSAPDGMTRFQAAAGQLHLPMPQILPVGAQVQLLAQPSGSVVVTLPDPALPKPVTLQPGPSLPVLPPGQILDVRVVGGNGQGLTRLAGPQGTIHVALPDAWPEGLSVRVMAQANGGVTLVPLAPPRLQPLAAPAVADPASAVQIAARSGAARQDGMAHLFADVQHVLTRPDVPADVRQAAEALLRLRMPAEGVARPGDLAQAVARSGLLAERVLANLPASQAPAPDIKLVLFVLRAALGNWAAAQPAAAGHADPHVPPPAPGTPPAAQAPVQPAADAAPRLVQDTEAALARVTLHQIASLRDEGGPARNDAPDARWSCEVPVNLDGRTAMFGFVVERDARHGSAEREARRWRVRAAIDLAERGAVEADVRLRGEAVTAGLLVERAETADMLEAALPMLRDGLTGAGFEVDALSVRCGRPMPEPGPPGHFVDTLT